MLHYDQFIRQVQRRARLGSDGDAVRVVRATLETLAERLPAAESRTLRSLLPPEIGLYFSGFKGGESFSVDEFYERVGMRAKADTHLAVKRAWAVMSVVDEVAPRAEMNNIRSTLPEEYGRLFHCAI
ncbi:MAG: DUF2267 domain-containing protein [Dehalococcoidia bacterium]